MLFVHFRLVYSSLLHQVNNKHTVQRNLPVIKGNVTIITGKPGLTDNKDVICAF